MISRIDIYGKFYMSFNFLTMLIVIILSLFSTREGLYYSYIPKRIGLIPIWFLQLYLYPSIITSVYMFDILIYNMLQLIIMQIKLLKSKITTVSFEKTSCVQMRQIILKYHQHHMFLVRYTKRLNDTMALTFFVQLGITVISLCSEIYILQSKIDLSYGINGVAYVAQSFFQIYVLYCKPCQDVSDQSMEITDSLFGTDWYNSDNESLKKLFLMVMMKCSEPITISTFCGVYNINLMACVAVFKTTYSFYSFLNTVEAKEN
ncbi:odorant receptor 22b-like [Aethina tumida]|uniref:odorant receptor 22b-like n=1 Tax=Aethina tumida TaxID=116153 RepID=UPI002148FAF0|nr:odorant receptor 22b-like [Aethina tumida]